MVPGYCVPVKRLPEIAADVSGALKQGKLLSEVVVGKGTEARLTVDGLKAVNRQLRQDILPKVARRTLLVLVFVSNCLDGAQTAV